MDRAKPNISSNEMRLLCLLIDDLFYQSQTSVQFVNLTHLVEHYLAVGWRDGYDPCSTFQSVRYANATEKLREKCIAPFAHYLFERVGEGLLEASFKGLDREAVGLLRDAFDTRWYLHQYPDIDIRGEDPFIHYMVGGWRQGGQPSRTFPAQAYLEANSDIREGGVNPFQHWVLHGRAEGRKGGTLPPRRLGEWDGLTPGEQAILTRLFTAETFYRPLAGLGVDPGEAAARTVSAGVLPGVAATPTFRAETYLKANQELIVTCQVPLLHFLFARIGEERCREAFLSLEADQIDLIYRHFDAPWYLYSYPEIEADGSDAFIHYMTTGWRERRDPSPEFSTSAYLLRYPDIAKANINPFVHWVLHGKAEGRSGASSSSNFRTRPYRPSIAAIVMVSAERPVSPDCLSSVTGQSYDDLSILLVGDAAALDSVSRHVPGDRIVPIETPPGAAPWDRLRQSLSDARSELVWFVDEASVYDPDYIARLASSFADGSVQVGFGRFIEPGDFDPLAADRSQLVKDGWNRHVTTPAAIWFDKALATGDLSAPDRGFVWRRRDIDDRTWHAAENASVLGIWHLLLFMASGGQIASVRDALARRIGPGQSTGIPAWPRSAGHAAAGALLSDFAQQVGKRWPGARDAAQAADGGAHILIVTHGIFAGGAENLPIQMANSLAERGVVVSMLIFKTDDINQEMRATLDPGVSIYEAEWVLEYGCDAFVRDIGCTLIHSHGIVGETFFFGRCECDIPVPYIATLHGSYEASKKKHLPEKLLAKIVGRVDLFIYTADKNLAPLQRHNVRLERVTKMSNAMPVDPVAFPQSRAELGIAEDAVVFTLVARGIKEKGWSTAIKAFKAVRARNPGRAMHLCLVGEGDEPDRLEPQNRADPNISFLGYQLRINGLYRLSDVAIVPTRFVGESFPLCIIQALQVGCPVIGTNVGEIASMLLGSGEPAGLVVEPSRSDKDFETGFAAAMDRIMDDQFRANLSKAALAAGKAYDMNALTDRYIDIYRNVTQGFHATRQAEPADPVADAAAHG